MDEDVSIVSSHLNAKVLGHDAQISYSEHSAQLRLDGVDHIDVTMSNEQVINMHDKI
jgi:hypothetical protein